MMNMTICLLMVLLQQGASDPSRTSIVPERFLRSYDPITVFFAEDIGPQAGAPLDQPGALFQLQPQHPGTVQWLNSRTLQFNPTVAWPALERFSVTTKGAQKTLETFMAPPTNMEPRAGASDLEPFASIRMALRYPVQIEKLAQMIRIEVRDLPGLDLASRYWIESKDLEIKRVERTSLKQPPTYQINLANEIPYGKAVFLRIRLSQDRELSDSILSYQWRTKSPFRLLAIGSGTESRFIPIKGTRFPDSQALACAGHQANQIRDRFFLEFSSEPEGLGIVALKKLVRIEPAVQQFQFREAGKRVYLQFAAEPETSYRLELNHEAIRDRNGRVLEPFGTSSCSFFLPHEKGYLACPTGDGIVERMGPQQLPLEGGGFSQVDLRVYKIDPLDANFWPFPRQGVVVDENVRPAGPGEEPEPASNLHEHIRQLQAPPISRVVPLPAELSAGTSRFGLPLESHLEERFGKDRAGTYLVGVRELNESSSRHYVRLQVTDLCLTSVEEEHATVFAVTSLKTMKPVAGAVVEVQAEQLEMGRFKGKYRSLAKVTTNEQGIARVEHRQRLDYKPRRVVISKAEDHLVLDVQNAPPVFADNHWFRSYRPWLEWWNRIPQNQKDDAQEMAFVATERPVYRPEDAVHIKGFYRLNKEGQLIAGPDHKGNRIVVQGPGGKSWEFPVTLTKYGSFYHKFHDPNAPTGRYTVFFKTGQSQNSLGYASFQKEAYRIPRFEVDLDAEDQVPNDRPFEVALNATYYAGGKVADTVVDWNITQRPYTYQPKDYPGFAFSSSERLGRSGPPEVAVKTFSSKTDEKGFAKLDLNPQDHRLGNPQSYLVEATVNGLDEQTVTQTKRILALPPFILGLQLERVHLDVKTLSFKYIVLDHQGEPLEGKSVSLRLLQRQWHSYLKESDFISGNAKYVTDVVDTPILERELESSLEPQNLALPIDEPGVYLVELTARDRLGRTQRIMVDTFVSGPGEVAWQQPQKNVFETVWSKPRYQPGEMAELILKSPFQDAEALVVVEGTDRNNYHWVAVKKGQGRFSLKVEGNMAPRIPIHILIGKGRPGPERSSKVSAVQRTMDLNRPMALGNTSWLQVEPRKFRLNLELTHKKKVLPGQTMELKIEMKDPTGNPLNGEVTLWLVDRAVLALGQEGTLDPVPSFLKEHGAWVRLRDTRNWIRGQIPFEPFPGGGGDLAQEKELLRRTTVRKNFKTVPYYNPSIEVVAGQATVQVQCPDNLTDFAIRAIATDGDMRFGFARSKLAVRLPVIVQPSLPRFVRPGDSFVAGGIGRVVEGPTGQGSFELEVDGVKIASPQKGELTWDANQPVSLHFPFELSQDSAREELTFRLGVERTSDQARDAFELKVPVVADRDPLVRQELSWLKPGQDLELLNLSGEARTAQFSQSLLVSDRPALIGMINALDRLHHYPHACLEQRISQLFPELALESFRELLQRDDAGERISHAMTETFKYLEMCQINSGLFAFWPGGRGYVHLTAYAVEFLLEAKAHGYPFNPKLLDNGLRALRESLRSDYSYFVRGNQFFERAQALAVLARAGEMDVSYATDLAARAKQNDLYSQSRITKTLFDRGMADDPATQVLLDDLKKSLIFVEDRGKKVFRGLQYRSQSWSDEVLASEVKTMAGVTRALYRSNPEDPDVELLVSELVRMGLPQGWGSTQADASALLALADVLEVDQEPDSAPTASGFADATRLTWSNSQQEWDTVGGSLLSWQTGQPGSGNLILEKTAPEAPMLVLQRARFTPKQPGYQALAEQRGFVVQREIQRYRSNSEPPERFALEQPIELEFQIGDVLEEHLQLINPDDAVFVALRVPFAAGLEPLNPELATAPPEAKPQGIFTRNPTYALYEDDQVTFYFDELPKGTYHLYFRLKATFEGLYTQPPAFAEKMYQQEVRGSTPGARIRIVK